MEGQERGTVCEEVVKKRLRSDTVSDLSSLARLVYKWANLSEITENNAGRGFRRSPGIRLPQERGKEAGCTRASPGRESSAAGRFKIGLNRSQFQRITLWVKRRLFPMPNLSIFCCQLRQFFFSLW